MTTGLLIKTAREKARMSQAQLASKMGVTNHCISSWERGKRNPKYETLSRIADALGVDVNCLLLRNDVVELKSCEGCYWKEIGYRQKCISCRRNRNMKDHYLMGREG